MRTPLILVLPELGGIGKSSFAEQLVAIAELADRPVLALDGDPSSRGLVSRRRGRKTTSVIWPNEPISKASVLRDLAKGRFAVLDFGAGSSQTRSVAPTIAELCDGSVVEGVETVLMVIGESSKPGNSQSIMRLRRAYPKVHTIFVRNFKSGKDFSTFHECSDLPAVNLQAIPVAVMEWLSNHDVTLDPRTGEASRPALADLVAKPADGYKMIGAYLASVLRELAWQPPILEMLGEAALAMPRGQALGTCLQLQGGPMTDVYLAAHNAGSERLNELMNGPTPRTDQIARWLPVAAKTALAYLRARDTMNAERRVMVRSHPRSPSRSAM